RLDEGEELEQVVCGEWLAPKPTRRRRQMHEDGRVALDPARGLLRRNAFNLARGRHPRRFGQSGDHDRSLGRLDAARVRNGAHGGRLYKVDGRTRRCLSCPWMTPGPLSYNNPPSQRGRSSCSMAEASGRAAPGPEVEDVSELAL